MAIIGTVRLEEAKVFDGMAGTQHIPCFPCPIPVEIFWSDGETDPENPMPRGGWYWSATHGQGGPHSSSRRAFSDAEGFYEDAGQEDMERRAERH